jgi:hypothetical protein
VRHADTTSTNWLLWAAFLAGPTAWTAHELLSYALVGVACETGLGFVLHLVTLACLAVAGAGAYIAFRAHGSGLRPPRSAADLLAGAGILVDALFAFAVLMEGLPNVVVSPCL